MSATDKDTRRIPTGEGVMEDKKFNDIVYAYLQSISYRINPEKPRFIYENQLNYTRIAKELKMNLKTLKTKIKYLFENGYIVKAKENDLVIYKLPDLNEYYFIIPNKTLKYLIDVSNENVIMVYSYLGQLKNSIDRKNEKLNQNKRAYFTKSDLLIRLGYKTKTRVNGEIIERASTNKRDWERINNILDLLENKFKLIKTSHEKEEYNKKTVMKYYFTVNTEI